jgi:TetR/AcrR family transcriptional regulator, transcriptional repressor for nem operon
MVMAEPKGGRGSSTRDQILEAAARLIHLKGYHCTSLDDVLRESGVGKGNFYYHFRSKEDLGYAILDRVAQGFVGRTLEPCFTEASADPLAQIETFLDCLLDGLRPRGGIGGCPMGNLASELSDVHEGFRQRLADIFLVWRGRFAEALGRGQVSGRLRPDFDPVAAAQFLVAAVEGSMLLAKVARDVSVMERCTEELKRHLALYAVAPEATAASPRRKR